MGSHTQLLVLARSDLYESFHLFLQHCMERASATLIFYSKGSYKT